MIRQHHVGEAESSNKEVILRRQQSGRVGNATTIPAATQNNSMASADSTTTIVDNPTTTTRWLSFSPMFTPSQSQRNWFFLIRLAESVPGINTFYNFWLDDEEPPTTGAIKDILSCLATVDTLLIGALSSFVSAVDFDELTEHNLRFSKKVIMESLFLQLYYQYDTVNC